MTPAYTEFTYTDALDVEITAYEWRAEDPVAIVQISHGIGEHAKRYDAFAQFLTKNGFTVYADDHRGHGATGLAQHDGDLTKLGRLGEGGLAATENAILQLTAIIRERNPGLSVVMFAHSWGSLMAQRILNSHPRAWDALVLSGSALRTFRHMESGNLNAKWAGPDANGFEWLSRDEAEVAKYIADPLCFEADILRLFGVADGLRLFGRPVAGLAPEMPILIISGAEDPIARGDSLPLLAEAFRKRGVQDVALKTYPGARHETLNETNRDQVFVDLSTWMLEQVSPN
ncbi:alpha-beta hydrolase superfamily lysophospholipase [Leucobacter exalbidus]|uniref:Alpha-beta hydrolase superfamily lysophospholipase n=1 Tax=Leucobacter exalbidus TaxID=662960 RepID=A0A940T120_9MICO|nr:alpha/beta hydrolase [Leucobacter exalbidus]MBP1326430.1 alpha-beta hydrolase superfamily lysophospholipase [Leucobacter exalbidus]